MKKVDIFSIQVSYTGTFESHSIDDWASKAQDKAWRCDCYDKTIEVSDQEAKRLDGSVRAEDTYPCNKIATVIWAYIREEETT